MTVSKARHTLQAGKQKIHQSFNKFLMWRSIHITDSGFVIVLSILIGLLTGMAASVLKYMIGFVGDLVELGLSMSHINWIYLVTPLAGFTLTGLFCRYVLKADMSNGVAKLMNDLKNKQYNLGGKTIYGSVIASALTLGFGGSAGSEGPIVYASAGIASKIGRFFKVSPRMLLILIGCGAASGIAGIFKAPTGGALFTLEVLRIELSTVTVIGVFMSCVTSALVAYSMSGCTVDINVVSPGVFDTNTFLWLIPLGVVCGLYSLYYTYTGGKTKYMLEAKKKDWQKYLISGVLTGAMIFLFPALYGEGYDTLTDVINGSYDELWEFSLFSRVNIRADYLIMIVCTGILLCKGVGSSAANNGGGVAGDFAPAIFAGCILGLLFAVCINSLHLAHLNAAHYALIAMGGAMAGIIRAPLMSMFLVTEMIGGFLFLLPSAVVSVISYGIVMIFKHDTFYHSRPFKAPEI